MVALKPTLRDKNRYLLFELKSESEGKSNEAISEDAVKELISKAVLSFIGELGYARTKPKLMEWDVRKKRGILRCVRGELDLVKQVLVLASGNELKVHLQVIHVSGLIIKLRNGRKNNRK